MSTAKGSDQLEKALDQTDFDIAVDALLDAGRGWVFGAPPHRGGRHHGRVAGADARAIAVQRLLDELCDDLGFCLPPREQARLRQAPPLDPDAFTDAVFVADEMDPRIYEHLRREVKARVDRRLPDIDRIN